MASIPKTERILNLIALLLKSRQPVSWRAIRESVVGYNNGDETEDSVARRFERDKVTLREIGVPLEYLSDDGYGNEGYRVERGSYFLPHLELSPEEIAILALAARAAPASGALGAAMQSALTKLEFDSPIPGDVRSTVEEHFLFCHPESEADADSSQKLEALSSAILSNKTVEFDYFGLQSRKPSRRRVDPYGMAFWSGLWYLAGHCHERRAVRTFRLDRIEGEVTQVDGTDKPDFELPPGFDVERHVGRPPWQLASQEPQTVTIEFDGTVAWMVRERAQETDVWRDKDDGGAILERRVTDMDALIRWLLRFGAHAEMLAPIGAREQVIDALQHIQTTYADKATEGAS